MEETKLKEYMQKFYWIYKKNFNLKEKNSMTEYIMQCWKKKVNQKNYA